MEPGVPNERGRLLYMDNIKGLLILLVVFAHCLYDFQSTPLIDFLVLAIYFFHMPAFVFTSGFFSNSGNARTLRAYLRFILSYLFIITIYIVLALLQHQKPHLLSAYYSEWYLVALVIWRILAQKLEKSNGTVALLVLFSVVAGYWPDLGGNTTLSINKVIVFFPFFFAGFLLDGDKLTKIRKGSRDLKAAGLALLAFAVLGISASYNYLPISMADVLPQAYPLATLTYAANRLIVYLIASMMIAGLLILSPEKNFPLLTKAGKNSFAIYLIHRPLTLAFSKAFASAGPSILLIASAGFAVAAIAVLGSDHVSGNLNRFLNACVDCLTQKQQHRFGRAALLTFLFLLLIVPAILMICQQ